MFANRYSVILIFATLSLFCSNSVFSQKKEWTLQTEDTRINIEFEDGSNPSATLSGTDLMEKGIMINLEGNESSELMFITLIK